MSALRFSSDGRYVAGGESAMRFGPDGRPLQPAPKSLLQVWRLMDGSRVVDIKHDHRVEDVDFDPDGRRIVTASFTAAYVWSLPSGELVKRIDYHTNVFRARFNHNGQELVLGCNDGAVFVWDAVKYASPG